MANWHNVSKSEPCPICHKTDWCNLSNDGAVAICHRIESPHLARSGSGWIHALRANDERRMTNDEWRARRRADAPSAAPQAPALDFARVHAAYDDDPILIEGLGTMLGVYDEVLKAMDVRFNRMDQCWSFPMRDAEGRIVGLRFRELCGSRKWSARGSHDGLFYAPQPPDIVPCRGCGAADELVIVEGASDTATALMLGLNAVGRSSCQTGAALLRGYIRRTRPRLATIVADNDEPGIRGADLLARQVVPLLPVRVLVVPTPFKDLRAWHLSNTLTPKLFADLASAQRWQKLA